MNYVITFIFLSAAAVLCIAAGCIRPEVGVDWPVAGGDPALTRYANLDQINRNTVADLELAWTYHSKDARPEMKSTIECIPVVVEGVMYVTSPMVKVIALDAATGKELWVFDPYEGSSIPTLLNVNRGVTYWSDGQKNGQRRVLVGTIDGRLISLDTRTGIPDESFGKNGTVYMSEGLERDVSGLLYGITSPPALFGDLVIVGVSNGEGPGNTSPGDIRTFDIRTGEEIWRFQTVPQPGESGNETWEGDSWKNRGGANAWSGLSVDLENGLAFAALGSASFDIYGGDRLGKNLYANSVVALNATTGEYKWHFQTVHHDLWDYDLPHSPILVQVTHQDISKHAVAQVTKTGFIFLLDRLTGEPLFEVEERPVPVSDVPGEVAWPTQPFPLKPPPIVRQEFSPQIITSRTPEAREAVLESLTQYRYGALFTPPSIEGTIIFPGLLGGANWSGASFDSETGWLYVNANELPYIEGLGLAEENAGYRYQRRIHKQFLDPDGYPAVEPPWGTLTAVDLNKGEIVWSIPLGEFPELAEKGVARTGSKNFGGTIVTKGGVVFVAATVDEKFRAFDKIDGKVLWEYQLEFGGYATPCTYEIDGQQFVAIAAGGGGRMGTRSGDAIISFSLPATQ